MTGSYVIDVDDMKFVKGQGNRWLLRFSLTRGFVQNDEEGKEGLKLVDKATGCFLATDHGGNFYWSLPRTRVGAKSIQTSVVSPDLAREVLNLLEKRGAITQLRNKLREDDDRSSEIPVIKTPAQDVFDLTDTGTYVLD